jgi:hypothetical protein
LTNAWLAIIILWKITEKKDSGSNSSSGKGVHMGVHRRISWSPARFQMTNLLASVAWEHGVFAAARFPP